MFKSLQTIKKALWYFRPFKWAFVFVIVLSFVQNSVSYSTSYLLGKVVDAATQLNQEHIKLFLVLYIAVSMAPPILNRIRNMYEIRKTDFDFFNHIQRTTLFKSLNLSLGQLRREHSGFKQDVLRSGENSLDYFHMLIVDEILPSASSFIVAMVGLYFLGPTFFWVALIFSVVYIGYGSYANSTVRKPLRELIDKRIHRSKVYVDLLRSLFFIKFANQKHTAADHLGVAQADVRNFGVSLWTRFHWMMVVSDLMLLSFYGIFGYVAYLGLADGSITVGSLVPTFSWMFLLSTALSRVRNLQRRTLVALSDLEKMFTMLEQKTDIHIEPDARAIKVFEDKITFDSVAFDYHEGKKGALQDITFEIKKGEKVALVGRSGSGKTTIVSLMLRLFDPTAGSISVDRVELKALELSDWHDMLAYVPQDGDLLDISIRDNILFGAKRQVTEHEIEAVLEKAGIKEFIHNLPNGVDTLVGERGVKLSGGQKQRVCIARALIKDAPILLLDEATSSLDSETETVVNKAIWEMLGDKTGVVIAHRLSTIIDADKIIVMDHGQIVGIGTHKELLKSTPYYKTLVDAQNVNL